MIDKLYLPRYNAIGVAKFTRYALSQSPSERSKTKDVEAVFSV